MDAIFKIEVGYSLLIEGNAVPVEKIEIAINSKSGDIQIVVILAAPLKPFSGAIQIQPSGTRPILVKPVGNLERNAQSLLLTTADTTERWVLVEYIKFCAAKLR